MKIFECDFETNSYDYTHADVWAWGAYELYDETFTYGSCIESFFKWFLSFKKQVYFHNLEFDGCFLMDWLLKNGFAYTTDKQMENGQFSAIISNMNRYYQITVKYNNYKCVINDTLKTLTSSVKKICTDYGLPIEKGSIDYHTIRIPGDRLNKEDLDYLKIDCQGPAMAQKFLLDYGLNHITAGSNAFHYYVKKQFGEMKMFRKYFPVDGFDAFVRKSYRGGFTYLNPKFQDKILGKGMVVDVNSMYPSVMHSPYLYPYGNGVYGSGKYKFDSDYPLFFQSLTCDFKIKPNKIPTFQLKSMPGFFKPTEYPLSGDNVTLTVTSVDFNLLTEHYNLKNIQWNGYVKYAAKAGFFDSYIEEWYYKKSTSPKGSSMYALAKLMQNSLYGKFATHPIVKSRHVELLNNMIHFTKPTEEKRDPIYVAVASYVTSYGRNKVIRAAQDNYDRFIYADTDSLHLICQDPPKNLELDKTKLGAWDDESYFNRAKFMRPKLYMEEGEKLIIKGAGMSDKIKEQVTFDNLQFGKEYQGNLKKRIVPGGCVLIPTTFKIYR